MCVTSSYSALQIMISYFHHFHSAQCHSATRVSTELLLCYCATKSHITPLQLLICPLFPLHCTGIWLFEEHTGGKIHCMPRVVAKTPQTAALLQKPLIWGAPIPPGLNVKAKKHLSPRWTPPDKLHTMSDRLEVVLWWFIELYKKWFKNGKKTCM